MQYSINQLAKLAEVSTRTLRYYDQIGLLKPTRISSSGYRVYGEAEVDTLQQILFFRALGVELAQVKILLTATDFDRARSMEHHLDELLKRRTQLDTLIHNAEKTIAALKGEVKMTDQEKFEGLKEKRIEENEERYGAEIRKKYGDAQVDAAHACLKGKTQRAFDEIEQLTEELNRTLAAAVATGDPLGTLAQNACVLHEKWLRFYTPSYTKEYHRSLGEMYVQDERFTAYYEQLAPGCAAFLKDAIDHYCA